MVVWLPDKSREAEEEISHLRCCCRASSGGGRRSLIVLGSFDRLDAAKERTLLAHNMRGLQHGHGKAEFKPLSLLLLRSQRHSELSGLTPVLSKHVPRYSRKPNVLGALIPVRHAASAVFDECTAYIAYCSSMEIRSN